LIKNFLTGGMPVHICIALKLSKPIQPGNVNQLWDSERIFRDNQCI